MEKFRPIQSWEDYFIPGTTVLRNKFGETDPDRLRAKEEFAAHVRLTELAAHPIDGDFDYAHMKAIHRAIFQDVYDWAGVERVGPDTRMTKDGPDVVNYPPGDPNAPTVAYGYYPGPQIAEAAGRQYALLAEAHHLLGLAPDRFVERLAEHWGELNTIHSFREGNSRAQFVFFTQLAGHAGYLLDPALFAPGQPLREEFVWARFHNQATGRADRLAAVLDKAITPTAQTVRIHQEALRAALEQRERLLDPDDDTTTASEGRSPYRSARTGYDRPL